jgi:hypothetical protein
VERPPEPPSHGRIDVLTVSGAAIAVGGFAVGAVFGLKALGDKPKSGFVTGRDGSYGQLQSAVDTAHREAIVSDIGFAAGIVATAVTTYLFFGRTRTSPSRSSGNAGPEPPRIVISGAALPKGGALFLGARF